jgi:hypothetical protein
MAFRAKYTLPRVDDFIINHRMNSIYQMMLRKDYRRSMNIIKNTLHQIQNAPALEFDPVIVHKMETKLCGALVYLATRRYNEAHNYIRDLHYILVADAMN